MKLSIIITTNKGHVETVKSLSHCPVPYQLILSKKFGLGFARNWGAKQAKNDLLVFLDDDLELRDGIWNEILATKKNEFRMTKFADLPCTRVLAIHTEDFWKIGGFDESVKYTGEDRIFYLNALDNGLKFTEIPHSKFVLHKEHPSRGKLNRRLAINSILESSRNLAKYGWRYDNPLAYIYIPLRKFQLKNTVIQFFSFAYYAVKTMLIRMLKP